MPAMQEACFAYFQRGGICASGPIRLLAGLTPNYWVLFAHFFAVALFGFSRIVLPLPLPSRIALATRVVVAATKIIAPLIAQEGITFLKYWPLREAIMYSGPYKRPPPAAAGSAPAS
jgi:squalene monooxygenase